MPNDITIISSHLSELSTAVGKQVGNNNPSDPRHGLISAMTKEAERLNTIKPESLTIFEERRVLTQGLKLSHVAQKTLKGKLAPSDIDKEMNRGHSGKHKLH